MGSHSGWSRSRAASYSSTLGKFPILRNSSCRRFISPEIASYMRSTSMDSSARLVITAEVCGKASKPRNVAPPLKSTSTKLRACGGCVAASATTSVRRSSDFPDPVAPMHNPCGPIPPCAASLISTMRLCPSLSRPMGTLRRCSPRGCHKRSRVCGVKSCTPSKAGRPAWLSRGSALGRENGASFRAKSRASASVKPSGTPSSSSASSTCTMSLSPTVNDRPSSMTISDNTGVLLFTVMTMVHSRCDSSPSSCEVGTVPSTTNTV